ncbi:MAG TPA: cysteine--tRNA ligase [Candidatus Saccharimonadales bacterium]|nr:cysteine--tRNA ligase [Candidatus Saccharimonadales bacterium]
MKLYNTLTRKVDELQPIKAGEVSLYTCGPTVYNYYHIGNLRNAVFNDTLRRTLEASGLSVRHVMNITDVGHLVSDADEGEDKLEKGAAREGKTVWEVADHYTEAFKADMAAMNVLPPSVSPAREKNASDAYARATDFIPEQIDMVQRLLDKGFAYQTKQAIYFDVTKLPSYGELSGQKLADKEVAARSDVVTDPEKHHPYDFAVWFFAVEHFADHSMRWPTPWGEGFPGWHLECSAIIHATLGDPIDIHTGGVDHIGTHHPNEMAQTEAAFGHQLANVWVHNEFILVDGAKMAKSKGNSYTLKDITDKGYDPLALRLLYLQAHYRSEINFTWESLKDAQNRLRTWQALAVLRFQAKDIPASAVLEKRFRAVDNLVLPLKSALQQDLNTPEAIMLLDALADEVVALPNNAQLLYRFEAVLEYCDRVFGLKLLATKDITEAQKTLIAEREEVRQTKDWARSDQLRDQLAVQGISLRDTPNGAVWYRI